jgi:predicted ribosome quality control (RQC) complex YloA/Tae2 family protein
MFFKESLFYVVMAKKSISSLELAALLNELQFVVRGKLSQVYHQEKKELLFQLHAPGRGKQLLKIIPGKFLCLTDIKKDAPMRPSGFCMQIRKHLSNASINKVYQQGADRIVVFELEKSEKYYIIIELFSKGNVILCDKDWIILGALEKQIWKDRAVKNKQRYEFPQAAVNWKELSEKEVVEIFSKSDRKNIATTLAIEIGFGGVYAEEILKRSGIDKNKLPADISSDEIKSILSTIKEILVLIEKSSGFLYEENITPFPLLDQKEVKKFETYNEAINTINPFEIISPYDKKIKALEKIIFSQEESIAKQEGAIESNKQKGELIYSKYAPLQKLLDIVKELRKEKEWTEIAAELKKEKNIVSVNLKDKTISIEL